MKFESSNEIKTNKEQALITAQFEAKCCNYGVIGHKSVHFMARRNHGSRQSDKNPQPPYLVYCRKTGHVKLS
jgi:hypothetical protein